MSLLEGSEIEKFFWENDKCSAEFSVKLITFGTPLHVLPPRSYYPAPSQLRDNDLELGHVELVRVCRRRRSIFL